MTPYRRLVHAAKTASQKGLGISGAFVLSGGAFLGFLIVLANAARLRRWSQTFVWQRRPASAPRQAATLWYGRMTTTLRKRGWQKRDDQTAAEFVEKIPDVRVRQAVGRFTLHYERARFAESAEDAQLLPELYEKVTADARQRR